MLKLYFLKPLNKVINYNFENIICAYATNDVIYYFKQNDIDKYIVNENGDIKVGKKYNKDKYKISIIFQPNAVFRFFDFHKISRQTLRILPN